jgi:hypothetical protein
MNHSARSKAAGLLALLATFTSAFHAWAAPAAPGPVAYRFEPLGLSVREAFKAGRPATHVLTEHASGYRVWCNSVIKGTDGKYHAYYARWPVKTGHNGWMTHCEVAHGISDQPEGPFIHQSTVIASSNPEGWDVMNAHNPYALVADGKVLIYYISNDIREKLAQSPDGKLPREVIRNSQATGVAIADSPEGPFRRLERPAVVPHGRFKNIAVNPAVIHRNGEYLIIIKGDDAKKERVHRIQLVGRSKNPDGPFTFLDKPVYAERQTEDACLWFDQTTGLHNMVCHVMGAPDLAWFVSEDGDKWRRADQPVFMKKEFAMSDGTVWKPNRVERPFVLTDELGRPEWFYVAIKEGDIEGNIALKVVRENPSSR